MRSLKRWFKTRYADIRNYHRRVAVADEISGLLGVPVELEKSGNRGQDDIYFVNSNQDKTGVLRLYNPHKKQRFFPEGYPFKILPFESRLEQEWHAYQTGYPLGLTPKPLWKDRDAILCEYLPYTTLHKIMLSNPGLSWELINKASRRLQDLHAAGITHMDASLANILTDSNCRHLVFIDFEFSPANGLSFRLQKLYDHLRLLESSLKFMPEGMINDAGDWLQNLHQVFGNSPPESGIEILVPGLPRLTSNQALWDKISAVINR